MHDTGHFLVTQTYGIIKACGDDASVSLNSSNCSFRSSLDLNVDLCSKNISTLEETADMKADLRTGEDENNFQTCKQDEKTTLCRHLLAHYYTRGVVFPPLKGFIRFI